MTYNITFLYPPTLSLANNNSKCVQDRSLCARDIISLAAALSFLGGSTWTVLLLWHLWQAGQSKEITAIQCLENFNFHTNYPHIVCHSVFFSGFFILCNWQKYKSKCLKRDIKFSLRMSVYLIFICKHSMLICKKKLICHFLVLCLFIDGAFKWFHVPLIWITS